MLKIAIFEGKTHRFFKKMDKSPNLIKTNLFKINYRTVNSIIHGIHKGNSEKESDKKHKKAYKSK